MFQLLVERIVSKKSVPVILLTGCSCVESNESARVCPRYFFFFTGNVIGLTGRFRAVLKLRAPRSSAPTPSPTPFVCPSTDHPGLDGFGENCTTAADLGYCTASNLRWADPNDPDAECTCTGTCEPERRLDEVIDKKQRLAALISGRGQPSADRSYRSTLKRTLSDKFTPSPTSPCSCSAGCTMSTEGACPCACGTCVCESPSDKERTPGYGCRLPIA